LRTAEYEKLHFQNAYLARLGPGAKYKTMQEMMEKVGRDKFSNGMIAALDLQAPDESADYLSRYRTRQMYIELITATMDRFALDAIAQPFTARPPGLLESVRRARGGSPGGGGGGGGDGTNNLSSSMGFPAVVVPGGYTKDNLPIAIQIMGRPFSDLEVLRIAYGYEQTSRRRKPPESTPALPGERFEYRSPGDNT
jgi:Asp-tRNA(Asn)/Glu-tRNA(Gln) amidotransferase A subunit family amidase